LFFKGVGEVTVFLSVQAGNTPTSSNNKQDRNTDMKTTRTIAIAALSLAIIATLGLSSCRTTGSSSSPSGAHTMGSPQSGYKMADR
jgi:hypothetical protein